MNAVDLRKNEYQIVKDRIEYNRSKTKDKRKDNAFISIKIIPEAKLLLAKYKYLSKRYATNENLNAALSVGMRQISELIGIPGVTFYWAWHSFANHARNVCKKSKDDVALALNHVDQSRKITDVYLEKDWAIIDEVQEAVLKMLRDLDNNQPKFHFQLQKLFKTRYNNLRVTFGMYFNC